MNYRELGNTGVKVSEISFGCWTMGGLNWVNGVPNGWASVDEDEINAGIKAALDAGVNHFDNADVYGNGKAEQMLRRVLLGHPSIVPRRTEPLSPPGRRAYCGCHRKR